MVTFDFHPTVGGIQTRTKYYVRNLGKMKNEVILVHLLNPRVLQTYFGSLPQDEVRGEKYLGATVYRYPSRVKFLFRVFFNVIKKLEIRDDRMEPWQDKKNLIIDDELCRNKKTHKFRMIFLTRNNDVDYDSVPDDCVLSEIIYRCIVCGKYYHEKMTKENMNRNWSD